MYCADGEHIQILNQHACASFQAITIDHVSMHLTYYECSRIFMTQHARTQHHTTNPPKPLNNQSKIYSRI
ncbi:hypothetical protein BO71DRAFT_112897 [Aspergillus ellipticus CBS 707.79]|uniref:Uncharacterized protein n=1 Tax=Aspergillus ellipticus CBS 707.79 TaxID=1448320 RepID=A0A319CX34_9EURO|nr:hypothetical protein BO71DRAFT_112897 [Aspergillus ellipticus CBS 707.79]